MNLELPDAKIGETARCCPDKTAIKSEERSVSYLELERNSNRIANFLHGKTGENPHVVIILDRSPALIEAIIGVLKCGLVFVPLNPSFPPDRVETMIREIGAQWVISDAKHAGKFRHVLVGRGGAVGSAPLNTLLLDDEVEGNESRSCGFFYLPPGVAADKLIFERVVNKNCYIYFTSGSTGIPKGVLGRVKSLSHFIRWEMTEFAVDESFNISQFTPPSFDPYLRDIFLPLMAGATCCIPGEDTLLDMRALIRWIENNRVTLIHTVPSLFKRLVAEIEDPRCWHSLKYILLAGELLHGRDVHKFFELFNDRIQAVNVYGPTETTLAKCFYRIREVDAGRSVIPVGKPIPDTQVMILDGKMHRCRPGKKGEIYIRTPFISSGYYNDPALTEKRFIKNPFAGHDKDIIYKTGDLGRELPDGYIEISGRADFQVKIRGVRIELGEIENRLLSHQQVEEAVVVARQEISGDKFLCAYFVRKSGAVTAKLSSEELRTFLSQSLPDYMIPNFFVPLEKLPLTANGKIDRAALPEPGIDAGESYVPPETELEEKLVKIWADELGLKKEVIGIDADFFDLGGQSLKAAGMTARIHRGLNVRLPLPEVFKFPTIRKLALRIKGLAPEEFLSIPGVEKREYYELSSEQKRLYVLQQMRPNTTAYNIPLTIGLRGEPDNRKMDGIFKDLMSRHESLRTNFAMIAGEACQRVHEPREIDFKIGHHDSDSRSAAQDSVPALIQAFIKPFDLSRAPLFRVNLIRLSRAEHRYLLLVDIHHIISDGVSVALLMREFTALYRGESCSPLRIGYKDYTAWRNGPQRQDALKKREDFWLKELAGDIPVLDLPADFARPATPDFAGRRIDFHIGNEQTRALKKIAAEAGATLYMVLLALFNLWLAKLSGREDIIIGTAVEGRNHGDVKHIVGMFVNTLPLRNYPAGEKTFAEFLPEVKQRTVAALQNGDYPFENMVEKLKLDRDMNRNPLFDVLFHLINFDIPAVEMAGLRLTPYQFEARGSKFDLSLGAIEGDDGLVFPVEYFTALFKGETVARLMGYFKTIVTQVLQDSGKPIKDIEILSGAEREKILIEFNDTAAAYQEGTTIHGLFEEIVQNRAGTTALVFEERHLTYFALNEAADRLAFSLNKKGIGTGKIVAILIERSPEMIVGLFAVLKTGGAYLPMDPAYPRERIAFMLKDSGAKILLTGANLMEDGVTIRVPGVETVFIETTGNSVGEQDSVPKSTHSPGWLAYIIYTSGSTGRPKGVAVAHRSIVNTLQWRRNYYRFNAADVVLQLPSISFDSSVEDIFTTLVSGSKLVLIRHEQRLETKFIKDFVKNRCITHFLIVPGLYKRYVTEIPGSLQNLGSVTLAGESFSRELVEAHFEKLPHVRLVNEYGPTENSVCATVYEFSPENPHVLIGRPIHNARCYVLDKNRKPVPIGVTGELCVAGKGVAQGYLNRPELTAERFTSGGHPTAWGIIEGPSGHLGRTFDHSMDDAKYQSMGRDLIHQIHSANHSDLLYKTGDLVRWLADGNLEFIGRIDDQVKIRGFRIEPGEVESRLKREEHIKDAVITTKEEKSGEKRLYAYILPAADFDLARLRRSLGKNLPTHMIPSRFFEIDHIPLTTNGKIDRQALYGLGRALDPGSAYVAPQGEKETIMAKMCLEVFGLEKIGVHDNFFDMGADSFAIMRLNGKLQDVFNREIPVLNYFEYPTIASFLDGLQEQEIGRGISPAAETEAREEAEWLESQKRGRDKIRKLRDKRVDDENEDPLT